jgi:hypothetical protein
VKIINIARKRSSYNEKDFFELQQHKWQQSWMFILKILFSRKLSYMSFINPTSTVGLQLLNLWLLKAMLRLVNDGVPRRPWNLDIRQP